MNLSRRKFFLGLGVAAAAPAIVRVASIMPVSAPAVVAPYLGYGYSPAMTTLDDIRFLQMLEQAQLQTMIYGTSIIEVSDNQSRLLEPAEFFA